MADLGINHCISHGDRKVCLGLLLDTVLEASPFEAAKLLSLSCQVVACTCISARNMSYHWPLNSAARIERDE
jgi:hypothetical protein